MAGDVQPHELPCTSASVSRNRPPAETHDAGHVDAALGARPPDAGRE